jgi:CubicO group peptidase (beta-lactamase class C family)
MPISFQQKELDEYLITAEKNDKFSGTVLVAKQGHILLHKGYGKANYELNVANTTQTVHRIGSLTKQFTAAAILQLQECGLLSVNNSIGHYLPNYPQEIANKVIIHHLLIHDSGIPEHTNLPEIMDTRSCKLSIQDIVSTFCNEPLLFQPGEGHSYSNSNYILLGLIIEKVSNLPYDLYIKENIFKPLGMKASNYDCSQKIISNRASGYSLDDSNERINAKFIDMSLPYAAGGILSTAEDLYKWDQALYGETILQKGSIDMMFFPHTPTDEPNLAYGYGWCVSFLTEKNPTNNPPFNQRCYHTGCIDGFRSIMARYLSKKICIIILSNNQQAPIKQLENELATILFGYSR